MAQDKRVISKLAILGGGSSYTPELIEGIVKRKEQLSIQELNLMDIDEDRLAIIGSLAHRMFEYKEVATKVLLSTSYEEAVEGADFIITQFRVGGMAGRILDERIPLSYGVIGQETTGPGGFSMALRTIPVMREIVETIKRSSPQAWLINFTNPSGLLTEATYRLGHRRTIGLCNGPIGMVRRIASLLAVPPEDLFVRYFGLNHLAWIDFISCRGKDVTRLALEKAVENETVFACSPEVIKALQMIPSDYLQYYYHESRVLEKLRQAARTRGEEVMEIEQELFAEYQDPGLTEKPRGLEKRGGRWYSEAAVALISSLLDDQEEWHIVDIPNDGVISDLAFEAVVEIPALVSAGAILPLHIGPLPESVRGLVQVVKNYEQLTIDAGLEGSYRKAFQALLLHPLVRSAEIAQAILDDFLREHADYLPQFHRMGGG